MGFGFRKSLKIAPSVGLNPQQTRHECQRRTTRRKAKRQHAPAEAGFALAARHVLAQALVTYDD